MFQHLKATFVFISILLFETDMGQHMYMAVQLALKQYQILALAFVNYMKATHIPKRGKAI